MTTISYGRREVKTKTNKNFAGDGDMLDWSCHIITAHYESRIENPDRRLADFVNKWSIVKIPYVWLVTSSNYPQYFVSNGKQVDMVDDLSDHRKKMYGIIRSFRLKQSLFKFQIKQTKIMEEWISENIHTDGNTFHLKNALLQMSIAERATSYRERTS